MTEEFEIVDTSKVQLASLKNYMSCNTITHVDEICQGTSRFEEFSLVYV